MIKITKDEAAEYIACMPTQSKLYRNDFFLQGFALFLTIIVFFIWRMTNVLVAISSIIVFTAALLSSSKRIMNKWVKGPYALLSSVLTFFAYSWNLAFITAYIIFVMSGNMALAFIITLTFYILDILLNTVFMLTMIKRKRYKQEKSSFSKGASALGLGGAGLGWLFAQKIFEDIAPEENLSIIATVTVLGGLLMNFGFVGLSIKYYCFILASKK